MDALELDPGFEPQTRARSNTWPLPRPENFVESDGAHLSGGQASDQVPKKNSSRRNAWGNMSYADLITQAIQSSPEKRLTLAQIYEWMVQNVAYFKDKGDSNSSAGWKNSIRHNLSLHNRFMRVQNEGTGKSSWWMINPDAKPGKAARRRATSMETHKYEKKRGRVKKKVEALRNGATPSPSSSLSEGQDLFPESPVQHGFQLSPDFRPRASSNASSCGRLSPIPAVESDMHDGDMPPLSPIPWSSSELVHHLYEQNGSSTANSSANIGIERFNTEHLVKSLAESMKLRNPNGDPDYCLPDCGLKPLANGRPPAQQIDPGYTCLSYNPPHYNGGTNGRTFPGVTPLPSQGDLPSKRRSSPPQQVIETLNGRSYNTLTRLQSMSGQLDYIRQQQRSSFLNEVDLRQPVAYKEIKEERTSPVLSSCTEAATPAPPYPHHHPLMGSSNSVHHNHHHHHHQSSSTSLVNTASHVVGHLLYNSLPQDLDFEPLSGALECDVDQVIRHELSVDGNLDFNFDSSSASASAATPSGSSAQHHPSAIASTRSWVH